MEAEFHHVKEGVAEVVNRVALLRQPPPPKPRVQNSSVAVELVAAQLAERASVLADRLSTPRGAGAGATAQ